MDPETVTDAIYKMYEALSQGDISWFQRRLLSGPANIHIGTATTYWMSADQFVSELGRQFDEISVRWRAGRIQFEEQQGIAWAVDRPVVRFNDGSETECRLSVIFARQGAEWHLAHSHLSVGSE